MLATVVVVVMTVVEVGCENDDLRSAASGKHPIGWETRAALVPLPNVVVVDGREGIDIARS